MRAAANEQHDPLKKPQKLIPDTNLITQTQASWKTELADSIEQLRSVGQLI